MKIMQQRWPAQLLLACALGLACINVQADVDTRSLEDYLNETENGKLLPVFKLQLPHK